MTRGHLEVLVEPFKENDPGPHVQAVVDALKGAGLAPDMGPFATTADGELSDIVRALAEVLQAGFAAGATAIQLRVESADAG